MKPKILLVVEPDEIGDYVQVRVSVSGKTDDGDKHWIRLYEQAHMAQELPDTMALELWALAAISEHSDIIKANLSSRINRGERTLMLDTFVSKEDLRVGARPVVVSRP